MNLLRNFVFTLNNYTPAEEDDIKTFSEEKAVYLIYGREVGDNGTPHLQGYIELARRTRFQGIHARFPRMHIEARRGTQAEATQYCRKDGDFVELGVARVQGHRSDVEGFIEEVKTGKSDWQLLETHPREFARFNRLPDRVRYAKCEHLAIERHSQPVRVVCYWGDAGVGKTRRIYSEESFGDIYSPDMSKSTWYDGYNGQDVLVLDDFYGQIKYSDLLHVLDRYYLRLPVKGTFTFKAWIRVYFTSNKHPRDWYRRGFPWALERRFDLIEEMVEATEVDEPSE